MPFLILSILIFIDKINLPILRALKILSERWYDTFGLLENLILVYLNKIILTFNYYLNFNTDLFETKILKPIQSISGRIASHSTDTTLNLILNTEGVFNYFFIGLIFFLWIYKSLIIYIKNQNHIFVFNLTFAIIFFLQLL